MAAADLVQMDAGSPLEPSLTERWALVTPHREHLLAIAQRRCPTFQDAEDCVHEAMVRTVAYPKLDPSRVAPLLTAMIVRLSADMARRRGSELRGRLRLVSVPEQAEPPDEAVVDQDEARWLAAQVGRLPERERQVFERRAAGLSAAETASLLQLSYKAVESAFTRARGRLRLWALTASLLIGTLVRRLRNRPSVMAAMLAVSGGCLLGSGRPVPSHASGVGPRAALPQHGAGAAAAAHDAIDNHTAPGATHAAPPRRVDHSGGTSSAASGAGPQGPQHAKPDVAIGPGPIEPSGTGTGTSGPTLEVFAQGNPVDDLQQCLAAPSVDPHHFGCPHP